MKDLHTLELAKFMFMFHHHKLPKTFDDYFKAINASHWHNTRSASSGNYIMPQSRTNKGKNTLQVAGVQVWNFLSPALKTLTYHKFKSDVRKSLVDTYT